MSVLKIAIDLAHGFPKDSGHIGIIAEEEVINEVGIHLVKKLKYSDHQLILSRPERNKKNDSISKRGLQKMRAKYCNDNAVDLIISIHASIGMGTGAEAYTYQGSQYIEAIKALENLDKLGFMNRGIKNGSEISLIKSAKAKVIMLSLCFIDTLFDVNNYYKVGAKSIADSIYYGAIEHTNAPENEICMDRSSSESWIDRLKDELTVQGYKNFMDIDLSEEEIVRYAPKISFGARGNITKLIQEKLGINSDGIFGNGTRNSLVDFQKEMNIEITGIVDQNTWKKFI